MIPKMILSARILLILLFLLLLNALASSNIHKKIKGNHRCAYPAVAGLHFKYNRNSLRSRANYIIEQLLISCMKKLTKNITNVIKLKKLLHHTEKNGS